jgi:hypothetical protein
MFNRQEYIEHDHKGPHVESGFSMAEGNRGDVVRPKSPGQGILS